MGTLDLYVVGVRSHPFLSKNGQFPLLFVGTRQWSGLLCPQQHNAGLLLHVAIIFKHFASSAFSSFILDLSTKELFQGGTLKPSHNALQLKNIGSTEI